MSEVSTRRVAIVGIDGSGKSSVIRRCQELVPARRRELVMLACPCYHETPDVPLGELSGRLEELSRAADALACPALKGAAMYLQMTLFGPVERFLVDTFRPRLLLSERHAVVDTLAYAPLYGQLVRENPDRARWEGPLRERLGEAAYQGVLEWVALEDLRLGRELGLWELPLHVLDLCARPWSELIPGLQEHYRAGLPDAVVLLDLPGEVALARVAGRSETREAHERASMLEMLGAAYRKTLEGLAASHGIEIHVVDVSRGGLDETVSAVLERVGLAPEAER